MRGLYIHIPFCKTICSYCDFPKRLADSNLFETYLNRIIEEIKSYKNELNDVISVYIGGGTPNVLPISHLKWLFEEIKPYLDNSKENTIELNPELVNSELCKLLSDYKFNRVSLGVQSFDLNMIKLLNRHHTLEDIKNAFKYLRENNINNINIDMMFGMPNSNLDTLKKDLEYVLSFKPTHISYYSLIIEEHTKLYLDIKNKKIDEPDDDLEADMYSYINQVLKDNGYNHYEVSNYAKDGYESIHNKLYWTENEYVGVGIGASGFINGYRYLNNLGIDSYLKEFIKEKNEISILEEKKE
ncbi:MAG: radical SAM family heme chaperone HemW, partial [Acholeplasmatales bacterium]|nr:radical SAM family heme chaperone HemW [Acholeplasmatales bacterium]